MKSIKNVLLSLMVFFVSLQLVYATKAKVIQTGLWKDASTWENAYIPGPSGFPDTILVPAGMNLIMSKSWDLSNGGAPMTIIIQGNDGVITMSNTPGEAHTLTLYDTSSVQIEQGASLSSSDNSGGFVPGCQLIIGTSNVWTSTNNGTNDPNRYVLGPAVLHSPDGSYPIELMSFDVNANLNAITIHWKTASETNSDYFEIQRSKDGNYWESLGRLNAAGNSNSIRAYSFEDTKPLEGANYYRLLQVDFDGQYEYFGPVYQYMGALNQISDISLFPNPSTEGVVSISTHKPMHSGDLVEIYDFSGRLLKSRVVNEQTNQMDFTVSDLPAGIYYIRYLGSNTQISKKLIIQ